MEIEKAIASSCGAWIVWWNQIYDTTICENKEVHEN